MRNPCLFLILLCSFITACHHKVHHSTTQAAPALTTSTLQRTFPSFNQLEIKGNNMNVRLHTGYKQPQLTLKGDPRDLAQINTVFNNNKLSLFPNKKYPKYGPIYADIRTHHLTQFYYQGNGVIVGPQLNTKALNLHIENKGTTRLGGHLDLRTLYIAGEGPTQINGLSSHYLNVTLKGNPQVQLSGFASIRKLSVEGGSLSFYWIKSYELIIRAKRNATIHLAGMVNKLDLRLWDNAHFKGRYLRVSRSFVKTQGRSVAEIASINHQSTLATDTSNIYYYNIPHTRADFMACDGSVLKLREWFPQDKQDFTRYNKQVP